MRRYVLLTVLGCFVATAAVADPADPDPDGIGIYFDEGAEVYCTDVAVGNLVTAYLCLTRPDNGGDGIVAWEAAVEVSVGGTFESFGLRGAAVNASTAPDFVVTLDEPLPWALSVVLVEMEIRVAVDYNTVLRVWPAATTVPQGDFALPVYSSSSEPAVQRTLGYSFGWDLDTGEPNWCAGINDPGCLDHPSGTTETTWGSVRSLYR